MPRHRFLYPFHRVIYIFNYIELHTLIGLTFKLRLWCESFFLSVHSSRQRLVLKPFNVPLGMKKPRVGGACFTWNI
jgi:hypothetical protein